MDDKDQADKTALVSEALADIKIDNFEIEDIADLNMYGPLTIISSTSSTSSCCG